MHVFDSCVDRKRLLSDHRVPILREVPRYYEAIVFQEKRSDMLGAKNSDT